MRINIRYSNGAQEFMTLRDDIEDLMFVVGGHPRAVPYDDGRVLVYSEHANRKKPNVKYKGKQLYGAIALMKEGDYERIIHG